MEPERAVILPAAEGETVGAALRPDRVVTVGRRKSDRMLVYVAIGLLFLLGAFTVFVSWQVHDVDENLHEIMTHCGGLTSATR